MTKKVFIQSLGCPKNLVDSEVMTGCLMEAGYVLTADPEGADILLVNTCGFIQPAVEEGIDAILALTEIKKGAPQQKLVVTGCMVQRYGKELKKELPEVDLFIGVDGFPNIVSELSALGDLQESVMQLPATDFLMNSNTPRTISTPSHRAYLKVTEGCSNRCSYCLIPKIRGPLRSRTLSDLLAEATLLEKGGIKELTLIAQDLTAYGLDLGKDREGLIDLLRGLLDKTSIPWIRLLYLYPMRVKDELLDLVAENPRILPYFDIPLQHISNKILKAMNRPYTRQDAEKLISKVRKKLPDAAIRTTFMVGFPGENNEDVTELMSFMGEQHLQNVGVFTYSNEEGCEASGFANQCTEKEKEQRKAELMALQADISLSLNRKLVGTIQPVIVEGISRESDLLIEGRTKYQAADIDGCVYINAGVCQAGDIADVLITDAHHYDLVGEIVSSTETG
ncbi:MAG: 30S ribosomal protein S12 methylthiotransferase RimO [Proteobacteria bacterium]|nr:30S ribosomal protein S12 methylthiotransferase RimO [Pseudomonadota bacterium]MBU1737483.1 30S ribosomal protein S12 methylthiotransferase RimO [Pseudomonadota bacterium]